MVKRLKKRKKSTTTLKKKKRKKTKTVIPALAEVVEEGGDVKPEE
jgi:hypothetical protein